MPVIFNIMGKFRNIAYVSKLFNYTGEYNNLNQKMNTIN